MRVEAFEVAGFLGNSHPVNLIFHHDLNVLTGKNGAGKTSLLKLMWCIMSGNIVEALREVDFSKAILTTDLYKCTVVRLSRLTCRVELVVGKKSYSFEDAHDEDGDVFQNAEDGAAEHLVSLGSSVFFPTFRRIEGGFTMGNPQRSPGILARRAVKPGAVEQALSDLSAKLSNGSHRFIAAISTVDIVDLLQKTYTDLSEKYNELQSSMSKSIVDVIKNYQKTGVANEEDQTAEQLLGSIRAQIESVELERQSIMKPIEEVQKVVNGLFNHKGIKLGKLSFGEAAESISSELLSAGEKQMLSFVSYNGLVRDSAIFIDEPELSLHVDWQRRLFSTLERQAVDNQFIIATHSPFIYSKYPDKEVIIGTDRGDAGS